MRLISYLRLIPTFRIGIETIVAVMTKSFKFYIILMIYVVATTFAHMALQSDDDFSDKFDLAYRMIWADFEEDYPTNS